MLGQSKLKSLLKSHTTKGNFPRTIMLEGEEGCGKHTFATLIAEVLNVQLYDLTEQLNLETLEQITLSVTPRLYVIDCNKISVKEQNVILKFLEEPLKHSYIVLLTDGKHKLLNTVVNRCICWSFDKYSEDQLKTFLESEEKSYILKYATTPGRVIQLQNEPILDMENLATKILSQVKDANYSNILTIPNRINFKDAEEKLNFDVFVYILLHRSYQLYCQGIIPFYCYDLTCGFYNDCTIPHINKQHLFETYLFKLKLFFEGGV